MKTLAEIEPRTPIAQPGAFPIVINQPGSYYLTGQITGVSGQNGIVINTDDVTLDLNGYAVVGAGSGSGIEVASGLQRVSVRNGAVRGWSNGVLGSTSSLRLTDLVASGNAVSGILGGGDSLVSRCIARQNGDRGIQITSGIVSECEARSNNTGITVTDGCIRSCTATLNSTGIVGIRSVVEHCTSNSNTADGYFISTGRLRDCVARSNGGDGIECVGESIVTGNTCASNGTTTPGAGIHCSGDKNYIEGNNVMGNDVGIDANDTGVENNVIIRNSASCNTSNYDIGANNQAGPVGSLTTIGANPWGNVSMTGFCS
jgi:hypothetical protein